MTTTVMKRAIITTDSKPFVRRTMRNVWMRPKKQHNPTSSYDH